MFVLPIIVTALGVFLLFKLRFFSILHPIKTARGCISSVMDGGFFSLALALAGTLGVGNIFGVAISITVGGAGSVLWLLISSVFAAIIKYAEALVSVDALEGASQGGMMYVIRKRLKNGKFLGNLYAAICLLLAFVMGAAMQSSAAVSSAVLVSDMPKSAFTVGFVALTLIFIFGNREKIKTVTAILIPVAALCYSIISLAVIFRHFGEIPRVINLVISSALTPRAAGGGILGYFAASPIVRGYSTGILSNEAGAGTSSMAHASFKDKTPAFAGLSGMLEAILDTAVFCMLTAIAILLPNPELSSISGAELVVSSLSHAFPYADTVLLVSVTAFALAAVVCWYYYGSVCSRYLFGVRADRLFFAIYCVAVLAGALFDCSVFASLSDVLLLLLALLTAPVIIKSTDRIKTLSELEGII